MARDLVEDRAFEARAILLRLADEHVEADDALIRTVNTLGSLAEFEFEHHVTLDDIAEHLDAQQEDDPSVLQAATLFAEHALAQHRTELVTQRAQRFAAIAETASDLDTARLRACLADADPSGDAWRELHRTARHTYPIPVRGLLAARRARFLATTGDMHGAVDGYYDAVELALAARTHQDAGEWLAAQRLVLSRTPQALEDPEKIFSAHGFEQVLRQASRDSVLPALQDTRASAMFDLVREKFHDARQHLLQYRRRAVAMGSWGHQCEAEQLLARLHMKVGNTATAMTHLMNSGVAESAKAVRTFIPDLPAQALDWPAPEDLASRPTWERTCAFAITERMADALTDSSARTWIDAALQEVATEAARETSLIALPDAVWGALAKLALRPHPPRHGAQLPWPTRPQRQPASPRCGHRRGPGRGIRGTRHAGRRSRKTADPSRAEQQRPHQHRRHPWRETVQPSPADRRQGLHGAGTPREPRRTALAPAGGCRTGRLPRDHLRPARPGPRGRAWRPPAGRPRRTGPAGRTGTAAHRAHALGAAARRTGPRAHGTG
ncbi:hypothetical protein [Streptomyces phaeochromogenes]|uniref:hypothetical protein n=1 Tax=Streptomyces phaeochromogenes TaxID=1923 RepID=UPI000B2297FE|nr:hypothetical protein [Streptomyces phaeochromogenes]